MKKHEAAYAGLTKYSASKPCNICGGVIKYVLNSKCSACNKPQYQPDTVTLTVEVKTELLAEFMGFYHSLLIKSKMENVEVRELQRRINDNAGYDCTVDFKPDPLKLDV